MPKKKHKGITAKEKLESLKKLKKKKKPLLKRNERGKIIEQEV